MSESYLIIYTILFILGLILGSFFNVLIIRLPKNKKGILSGRSFCPNCKKKIKWFDNLPIISFIILKGKCRKCKKKISFQYPLLEWFSAISFIFLFYYFDNYFEAFYFQIIILILIAIFLIDLRYSIIPNELNYTLSFFQKMNKDQKSLMKIAAKKNCMKYTLLRHHNFLDKILSSN